MTTQIQTTGKKTTEAKPSALALMASRLNVDQEKMLATLKGTVFQKATNEEMLALVVVANTYDLNPCLKELYAFPAKGGGIVPIVSVDGWNKMLIRQPDFDGIEFEFVDNEDGSPHSCTATVHVKNRSHAVKVTEYFDECKRNTEPWNNMPRRMLRNRTLCQASRMAFGISGVYNDDEAHNVVDVSSTVMPTEPPPKMIPVANDPKTTDAGKVEAMILGFDETFSTFQKFLIDSGIAPEADSIASFGEIPQDLAKRILRLSEKSIKDGMAKAKGGE